MRQAEKIVFYFPFHGIGGVSVLFLRMAEYLSRYCSVFVADYSDGYMARHLPDGVKLIRIDKEDEFPVGSIYVFQSFLPWRFPYLSKVDPESRILFWNLHPKNFDSSIFNENSDSRFYSAIASAANLLAVSRRVKLRSAANYLLKNDALVFMDRENAKATEGMLGCQLNAIHYMPVPVPEPKLKKIPQMHEGVIKCTWVGRIADFKFTILEHLIKRLSQASRVVGPIRLLIIGDGEYEPHIREVSTINQSEIFQIELLGEVSISDLPQLLAEQTDILFSMGTSALEGAAMGVPVFLTDYSYNEIRLEYRFSLLYENSGFCLGEEIREGHYEVKSTLESSIQEVMSNYEYHSAKCYEYWKENFNMENIGPAFLRCCLGSTATFGEMAYLGFFNSDKLGLIFRSAGWALRGRWSSKPVGFRHDC